MNTKLKFKKLKIKEKLIWMIVIYQELSKKRLKRNLKKLNKNNIRNNKISMQNCRPQLMRSHLQKCMISWRHWRSKIWCRYLMRYLLLMRRRQLESDLMKIFKVLTIVCHKMITKGNKNSQTENCMTWQLKSSQFKWKLMIDLKNNYLTKTQLQKIAQTSKT